MSGTEPTIPSGSLLADIEPELSRLRAVIGILGHVGRADTNPTSEELTYIEDRLSECHETLHWLWNHVWEERRAEREAHRAALAAAEARAVDAGPGSVAQMKRARAAVEFLHASHTVGLQQCDEMAAEIAAALAEAGTEAAV